MVTVFGMSYNKKKHIRVQGGFLAVSFDGSFYEVFSNSGARLGQTASISEAVKVLAK